MSKRLGKGLSALLPQMEVDQNDSVQSVNVADIRPNPYQPRQVFDDEKLKELSESIKEHGVIQPIIVRKSLRGYEIVAGERRWRAAKVAGLTEVPVAVRDYNDKQMTEIALIENLQREDLNPIEVAEAYLNLMNQFNLTQEELAKKVGQSRSHVANFLRLLQLPSEITNDVSRGTITMGHARAILSIEDKAKQLQIVKRIKTEELSVRQVEHLVNQLLKSVPRETKKKPPVSTIFKQYEDRFRNVLGTSVKIQQGKKRGKIEIDYFSTDDLERILNMFSKS